MAGGGKHAGKLDGALVGGARIKRRYRNQHRERTGRYRSWCDRRVKTAGV
jgi:hypothetical protein